MLTNNTDLYDNDNYKILQSTRTSHDESCCSSEPKLVSLFLFFFG